MSEEENGTNGEEEEEEETAIILHTAKMNMQETIRARVDVLRTTNKIVQDVRVFEGSVPNEPLIRECLAKSPTVLISYPEKTGFDPRNGFRRFRIRVIITGDTRDTHKPEAPLSLLSEYVEQAIIGSTIGCTDANIEFVEERIYTPHQHLTLYEQTYQWEILIGRNWE